MTSPLGRVFGVKASMVISFAVEWAFANRKGFSGSIRAPFSGSRRYFGSIGLNLSSLNEILILLNCISSGVRRVFCGSGSILNSLQLLNRDVSLLLCGI